MHICLTLIIAVVGHKEKRASHNPNDDRISLLLLYYSHKSQSIVARSLALRNILYIAPPHPPQKP